MLEVDMETMEQLSETIIAVLKELSTARRPLTTVTLSQGLSARKDILDLVTRHATQDLGRVEPAAALVPEGDPSVNMSGSERRKVREQEQKLLRQIAALEEASLQARSFSRKSALTLVVLASEGSKTPALSTALERYRSAILDDEGLDVLDERLQSIKEIILKEEVKPKASQAVEVKGDLPGSFLAKSPQLSAESGPAADFSVYVAEMQRAFLSILSQFETLADEPDIRRISDLKVRIAASADMEGILTLGNGVVSLLDSLIKHASGEREQVTTFVAELAKNLFEMERQMFSSLTGSQDSFRENKEFNDTLQVQMEDIRDSFTFAQTIEESRNYVLGKLNAIKHAIENKRRQDEMHLQSANEMMGELQKNLQNMKSEISRVQERTKTLEEEVLLDALTGIHNRRAYEMRLHEEIQRYHRYGQLFSLILFDVDHFKQVNDQYGHRAGDRCLREIIKRVKSCLRATDFLARFGGEEFTILSTGTRREEALVVAEKIRRVVEKTCFMFKGREIPVTISLGVAEIRPEDKNAEGLFGRADSAMYEAKNTGRNRVCVG